MYWTHTGDKAVPKLPPVHEAMALETEVYQVVHVNIDMVYPRQCELPDVSFYVIFLRGNLTNAYISTLLK